MNKNINTPEDFLTNTKIGIKLDEIYEKKGDPDHLFKYMCINDFTRDSLNRNYFYYCKPSNFNDPFDCYPGLIQSELTKKQYEKYFKKIAPQFNFDYSKAKLNLRFGNLAQMKLAFIKAISVEMERFGICCFTRNENNVLMWSHYADKHSGLCLKLKPEFNKIPYMDVIYTESFTKEDIIKNELVAIAHIALTKNICWEYENEMRALEPRIMFPLQREIKFNPESLEEIIFGYKADEKDIKDIIYITKDKYPNVKYKKAELKPSSFKLVYKDYR